MSKGAGVGISTNFSFTLTQPFGATLLDELVNATRGIVFPYTPQVMFGGNANYGNFHFTHSNFPYYQYQNSQPSEIQVTGIFTAQTNEEARYLLAVLKFLRGSTMIEFGTQAAQKGQAGTPSTSFTAPGAGPNLARFVVVSFVIITPLCSCYLSSKL